MAKVRITFKGDKIQQTVNGVKGAKCTDVAKQFQELEQRSGSTLINDEKTKEYHEEEVILENVNR